MSRAYDPLCARARSDDHRRLNVVEHPAGSQPIAPDCRAAVRHSTRRAGRTDRLSVRVPQESGSWSLLATLILAGMGPVIVPPNRLPGFMLVLAG